MVKIETLDARVIAHIYGEIDHHAARLLREEIDCHVTKTMPKELILDFEHVSFMDSSGIGLIMGRYKVVTSMGGEVKIIKPSGRIKTVMELAGLKTLVEIDN